MFGACALAMLASSLTWQVLRNSARALYPGNWELSLPGGSERKQERLRAELHDLNSRLRELRSAETEMAALSKNTERKPGIDPREQHYISLCDEFVSLARDIEQTTRKLTARALDEPDQVKVLLVLNERSPDKLNKRDREDLMLLGIFALQTARIKELGTQFEELERTPPGFSPEITGDPVYPGIPEHTAPYGP